MTKKNNLYLYQDILLPSNTIMSLLQQMKCLKLLRLFEGNKRSHCGSNTHKRAPDKNHCSTELEETLEVVNT